jgi:type II secretory pathway pseudopilin PulG
MCAFTIVESVICMLLVGFMLVAALNTLGSTARTRSVHADQSRVAALANQLMSEILKACYIDPQDDTTWGPETGETNRSLYDDVDDYDGWYASPPELSDGSVIDGTEGWARAVRVRFASLNDPNMETWMETGIARITVKVTSDTGATKTLVALRSLADTCDDAYSSEATHLGSIDMMLQLGEHSPAITTGTGLFNGVEGQESSSEDIKVNSPPTAIAQASTSLGVSPLLVDFYGGSSYDVDGNGPTSYTWSFGDGTDATGEVVSHTFWVSGKYIVTLTVLDDQGASGMDTIEISVY